MEYIQIGKLGKPHGLKGALKVILWDRFEELMPKNILFVEQKGDIIPFFIQSCKEQGAHLLVQFEDFKSPNDAYPLAQKKLFLREKDIPKELLVEPVSEFNWLIGMRLNDEHLEPIGEIIDFDEAGKQLVVLVKKGNKQFMIPWVSDYIINMDRLAKTAQLDLPKGLIHP